MAEEQKPVGDSTANVGDETQKPSNETKNDTVSYDTHRKLLAEKKKVQEQLETFLSEQKKAQEATLAEQNQWKKLAELKEKELAEAKATLAAKQEQEAAARKLESFLKLLPGQLEKQYWGLVDLDKIVTNPETGAPDEQSVAAYVKDWHKTYSKVVSTSTTQKLPNEAPQGDGSPISLETWKKLPLADKKKHYESVKAQLLNKQ